MDPIRRPSPPIPGVLTRGLAYSIDVLPIVVVLSVSAYLFWPAFQDAVNTRFDPDCTLEERARFLALRNVVRDGSVAVYLLYAFFAESWGGGTLGKHLLGLEVVDSAGNPARAGRVLTRTLAKPLSACLLVGVLPAFVDPQRRMLHDWIAGTRVARRDPAGPQPRSGVGGR